MTLDVGGAVAAHKKFSKELIRGSDQELLIRLPEPRITSGVNPLFGSSDREVGKTGDTKGPFKCIWFDALSARGTSSTGHEFGVERLMGQFREATAFAEVWLEDVLEDLADNAGATWFDKSQDVIYQGKSYEHIGEVRTGLATSAPYILMVVLKGGLGNVA